MTHLADALAVVAAEFRQARRLSRTWLIAFFVVVGGLFVYHLWSGPATFGATAAPRFALPGIGLLTLWVLLFGVVLLAFDIRARDERERIAAVLDARPIPNIVLLGGRLLGIVVIAWLPVAVWALALQGTGMVVDSMNATVGVPPEPVSLATFVFVDAPPALGKYRRTLTRIPPGSGEGRASFHATLPKAAAWRLSYHLPGPTASQGNRTTRPTNWIPRDTLGSLDIVIEAGERRIPVIFDARTAVSGWNDLGTFDLPAGSVTVVVSDATTGDVLVADAVRWEVPPESSDR